MESEIHCRIYHVNDNSSSARTVCVRARNENLPASTTSHFILQHGSGAVVSCREIKFGTRYESPAPRANQGECGERTRCRRSLCRFRRKYQVAARWRRRNTQPRPWIGLERARPGPSGLKSNLPDRLEFLGPLPKKKSVEWR